MVGMRTPNTGGNTGTPSTSKGSSTAKSLTRMPQNDPRAKVSTKREMYSEDVSRVQSLRLVMTGEHAQCVNFQFSVSIGSRDSGIARSRPGSLYQTRLDPAERFCMPESSTAPYAINQPGPSFR